MFLVIVWIIENLQRSIDWRLQNKACHFVLAMPTCWSYECVCGSDLLRLRVLRNPMYYTRPLKCSWEGWRVQSVRTNEESTYITEFANRSTKSMKMPQRSIRWHTPFQTRIFDFFWPAPVRYITSQVQHNAYNGMSASAEKLAMSLAIESEKITPLIERRADILRCPFPVLSHFPPAFEHTLPIL